MNYEEKNCGNNRNRVLIVILSKALEVVDLLVDIEKEKSSCVFFMTNNEKIYSINQVEGLFNYLILNFSDSCKLFVSDCEGNEILVENDSILEHKLDQIKSIGKADKPYLVFPGLSEQDTSHLEKFINDLENSFIADEKKERLTDELRGFISMRKQWQNAESPFFSMGKLENYLRHYYNLLLFLLLNENRLDEQELLYNSKESLLSLLLKIDTYEKDELVSLFSPLALNGIRKMYLLVQSYYEKIKKDKDNNVAIRFMEKRVIIEKVQHMFRWFFYDDAGKLVHVAVSPYDENEKGKTKMDLPYHKIENYNSFEAIYELRTAEKILYELKNWLKSEKYDVENPVFKVVLVGDLNVEPVRKLCHYLNNVIGEITNEQTNIEIELHLYSKTLLNINLESENLNFITKVTYSQEVDSLFTKNKLNELIDKNNAIFLLDCVNLYNPVSFLLELSPEYYKQRMANNKFSTWLLDNNIDYCNMNCLNEVYNCMNIYMRHGRLGKYVKRANEALVSYCQNLYLKTECEERSTLYIYVSDLKAFNRLYNDDNYYMRTERYNQKEIGIIRFTNFKKEQELNNTHSRMITFNLWQMVKHIFIKEVEIFINLMQKDSILANVFENVKVEDLQKMHVGIDYSNWKNVLSLHYYNEKKEEDKEVIRSLLKYLVIPVLKDGNDLFQQYFQRAVYSFLYGNAKTYDDMLFIYLFYNQRNLLGEISVAARNESSKVNQNINRTSKYSIKRFVEESIIKLDSDGFNVKDKYFIAGRDRNTLNKIYQNLQASCEQLGYMESCLYRNSKDEG